MHRWFFALVLLFRASLALAAVDLNTATPDMLEELHGIGPTRAQAIVEYRNQHGPFQSLDQLLEVKGIGPGILEGLRPQVVLGGDTVAPPARKSPVHGSTGAGKRLYFGDTPPH